MKHLIFDMDGTLADTGKATIAACEEARHAFGLPPVADELVYRTIGIANPEFYERLYPSFPTSAVHAFGEAVENLEEELVAQLGDELLFAGVYEMLEKLSEKGVRLYVASTGDKRHVDAVLKATHIVHFFDRIECGEPEKTAMVARIIGNGDKANWAMVGDRQKDVDAASNNGILSIGAGFGYCDEQEQQGFDKVAFKPMELLSMVTPCC